MEKLTSPPPFIFGTKLKVKQRKGGCAFWKSRVSGWGELCGVGGEATQEQLYKGRCRAPSSERPDSSRAATHACCGTAPRKSTGNMRPSSCAELPWGIYHPTGEPGVLNCIKSGPTPGCSMTSFGQARPGLPPLRSTLRSCHLWAPRARGIGDTFNKGPGKGAVANAGRQT